jgi:hypothetical protein
MNESDVRSQGGQLWKHLYRAAVLETNMELVSQRVLEARQVAKERAMHLIRESSVGDDELHDLAFASQVLDQLKNKCQSGRHSRTNQSVPASQVWTSEEQVS